MPILRPHENNEALSQQPEVAKLVEVATKFPEKPWYMIFRDSKDQTENVSNLQCVMKVAGDLDGDGQKDLVVLLRKPEKMARIKILKSIISSYH